MAVALWDSPTLVAPIIIDGPVGYLDLSDKVTAATLTRTIDGATTLEVDVDDHDRSLLRSGTFTTRSFTVMGGVNFELVAVRKSADTISLTFEDSIVAALRRRTAALAVPADEGTRQMIAAYLAHEAGVRIDYDPSKRERVQSVFERSQQGQQTDSWSLLGSLAADVGWRCFSDGVGLLFGSDAWLMRRLPAVAIAENTGPVDAIDFDLDTGQHTSSATVTVLAEEWTLPPGLAVTVGPGMGPANGKWLVSEYTRPLTSDYAALTLTRAQASLIEPPPSTASGGDDTSSGDQGEVDHLPYATETDAGPADDDSGGLTSAQRTTLILPAKGTAAYTALTREKAAAAAAGPSLVSGKLSAAGKVFVQFALAQAGKRYVWNTSGPDTYDCSGLVQAASIAAGQRLSKPAVAQWAQAQRIGITVSVSDGIKTPGALLFRINSGKTNHVAISLGDGQTVEANGSATGCGVFPNAAGRNWTGAAIVF